MTYPNPYSIYLRGTIDPVICQTSQYVPKKKILNDDKILTTGVHRQRGHIFGNHTLQSTCIPTAYACAIPAPSRCFKSPPSLMGPSSFHDYSLYVLANLKAWKLGLVPSTVRRVGLCSRGQSISSSKCPTVDAADPKQLSESQSRPAASFQG